MHDQEPVLERCHRCVAEADAYLDQADALNDSRAPLDAVMLAAQHADLWTEIDEAHDAGAGLRPDGGGR